MRALQPGLRGDLHRVYTAPHLHGHDIKLDSLKTSVAFKFMIILQNLIGSNHRESDKNKYARKLPELDVLTTRIWYCVNGVLDSATKMCLKLFRKIFAS